MTIQTIENNATYKQVLTDSVGGLMYNLGNKGKYDAKEVLTLWDNLPETEKDVAGGIMKGAIDFLKGE